ncbi:hypothetical protein ACB092_02G131500 [Castanea dentata]
MTPPLHSRFFVSTQVPCYLNWDYISTNPLQQVPSLHLRWGGISLFLKRVFIKFRLPETSSRFNCPFPTAFTFDSCKEIGRS